MQGNASNKHQNVQAFYFNTAFTYIDALGVYFLVVRTADNSHASETLIAHSVWDQEGRAKGDLCTREQKLILKIGRSGNSHLSASFGALGTASQFSSKGNILPGWREANESLTKSW